MIKKGYISTLKNKLDLILNEFPELKKSIEMKRKELEVISMKLLEQEKLSKANEAVLQEIKAEHDLLSKEIGEMREELLMRENKMKDKELELSARINNILNKEKLLDAKIDKLNKAIKECL